MTRIEEIEAREKAATPGRWIVTDDGIETTFSGYHIVVTDNGYYPPSKNDADFIANAREDIPFLLSEVKRLEGELKTAKGSIAELCEQNINLISDLVQGR